MAVPSSELVPHVPGDPSLIALAPAEDHLAALADPDPRTPEPEVAQLGAAGPLEASSGVAGTGSNVRDMAAGAPSVQEWPAQLDDTDSLDVRSPRQVHRA